MAGILAAILDVFIVAALSILGDHSIHDYISTLGTFGAPTRTTYVIGGTLASALHLWFAAGLWMALRHQRGFWAPVTLLSLFFIAQWLGAALWPCDPGCAWATTTGQLHYAVSLTGFVSYGLAILTFIFTIHTYPRKKLLDRLGWIAVGLALVLLAADLSDTYRGVIERIVLVAFGAWNVVLAWGLNTCASSPASAS